MNQNDEAVLEQQLASTAKASRVTVQDIDDAIVDSVYWNPEGTTLTICVLTLKNGFNVTGESAAASPENFNRQIGRDLAYEQAREKIWMLEGYLLKQKLFETSMDRPHIEPYAVEHVEYQG